MAKSELYEKGLALRNQLMGEDYAARLNDTDYNNPVMETFRDVAAETVFGALWSRPGLDLKTRTLICVITDAATGRDPELKLHVRMAINQGWTEDELVEVLLHMSGYVGVPLVREAMMTASKVFEEMRNEKT